MRIDLPVTPLYAFLGALITLHDLLGAAQGGAVCFDDLGCFSDNNPWSGTPQRPIKVTPWTPKKINTLFFLLTRQNPKKHQKSGISADILSERLRCQSRSPLKIIALCQKAPKGNDGAGTNLAVSLGLFREVYLQVEDVNCIGVDWRAGSGHIGIYLQAASNARVVGAEIAYLLRVLQDSDLKYPASKVHIIGHSLGAHVAGEAGKRIHGIRRITGLDPARLLFENTAEEVRLDPSDALFVDVIHTDANSPFGAGIINPVGHFDFYPNGGKHMAGCPPKISFIFNVDGHCRNLTPLLYHFLHNSRGMVTMAMFDTVACNHLRAFQYYTESMKNPNGFLGYPCPTYKEFQKGTCFPCPLGGCPSMGHFADSSHGITSKRQTFYLNTGGNVSHFSSWRYKISILLRGKKRLNGRIYISLSAGEGTTQEYEVVNGNLLPGNLSSGFIDAEFELVNVTHVIFKWSPNLFNIFKFQLGAERIEVQSGKDGSTSSFCTTNTVGENVVQTLTPC